MQIPCSSPSQPLVLLFFRVLLLNDTQRIEFAYFQTGGAFTESQQRKAAINGALMLYLDFINLKLTAIVFTPVSF